MSCNFISVSDAKFLIKYIFAFHIIKNNFYFFYRPIAIPSSPPFPQGTFSISTGMATARSLRPNRRASNTSLLPLSSPSQQPQPSFTNSYMWQIHAYPSLIPLIAFPIREFLPPDSRLWRSLTGDITRITSNYTRNTYIYYYIYLENITFQIIRI